MMGKERRGGQRIIRWEGDEREYDVRIKDFLCQCAKFAKLLWSYCRSHMHTCTHRYTPALL